MGRKGVGIFRNAPAHISAVNNAQRHISFVFCISFSPFIYEILQKDREIVKSKLYLSVYMLNFLINGTAFLYIFLKTYKILDAFPNVLYNFKSIIKERRF